MTITRGAAPLAVDRLWRATFKPADRALRLPADLTGALVQIKLWAARCHRTFPSDWWYRPSNLVLGTDTGEIVNNGDSLAVTANLTPGTYHLEGQYTLSGDTIPFISGTLAITDYASQLSLTPMGEV